MTKDEWKKIEEILNATWAVKLLIDGYKIDLILLRETTTKMVIGVYINGKIKGEWIRNDCEERRRFFQDKKRCMIKSDAKTRKSLKMTASEFKAFREKYTIHSYSPYWSSFKALKNHLIRNNDHIEILRKETKEEISNDD